MLKTSLNQVTLVSYKGSDMCVCFGGGPQLAKPQGEVDGSPRVAPHTEDATT